jgi:hypothetical protein
LSSDDPEDGHVVVVFTQAYKQAEVKSKEEVTAGPNEAPLSPTFNFLR